MFRRDWECLLKYGLTMFRHDSSWTKKILFCFSIVVYIWAWVVLELYYFHLLTRKICILKRACSKLIIFVRFKDVLKMLRHCFACSRYFLSKWSLCKDSANLIAFCFNGVRAGILCFYLCKVCAQLLVKARFVHSLAWFFHIQAWFVFD